MAFPFKEWVSYFLRSWLLHSGSTGANLVNREAVLERFAPVEPECKSHERKKYDTYSLYLHSETFKCKISLRTSSNFQRNWVRIKISLFHVCQFSLPGTTRKRPQRSFKTYGLILKNTEYFLFLKRFHNDF